MAANSKTADDSHSDALQARRTLELDFDGMFSDGLVNHGILQSKTNRQDLTCDNLKYDHLNNFAAKSTKESCAFLKNHRNMYNGLAEQTVELMQDVISRAELRDDDVGIYTLGLKAMTAMRPLENTNHLELENIEMDLNPRRDCPPPKSCSDHSDIKTAVSEKYQNFKEAQSEFIEVLKEKPQQTDTERWRIVSLLLLKYYELLEMSKLWKVEAQLMTEKLECEEQRNFVNAKKFNHIFEDMRDQLSMAKSKNNHFLMQLRTIMEKYERLKQRSDCNKKHLTEERTERKRCQKTLKEVHKVTEELLMNQAVFEEQRDAAKHECSELGKKIKTMEEENNKLVKTIQRLERENSSMRDDYKNLKDQLSNTQGESQKLHHAVQAKELERMQAEKTVQESQKLVKQLYKELGDCQMQRETAEKQLDTMEKQLNLIDDQYKMKTLYLQEQNKSCMEELEARKTECEAFSEVVSTLKKEKQLMQEALQSLQEETTKSELERKKEEKKMRQTVSLLEHERKLLLEEMGDLRKDYFSLSDRITQRLEQLGQTDVPMCITDISNHRIMSMTNNTVDQITSNMDMIEHIRRKLKEEENCQQK